MKIKKYQYGGSKKVVTETSLRPQAIRSQYETLASNKKDLVKNKDLVDQSARSKAIKSGEFREDSKTGDLFPTKKYYMTAKKKYQSGGAAPLKKVAKKAVKDSVESEMHPGKKIPVSKSNYETGKIGKMAAAGKPKAEGGKWIQKAIKKPGALRAQLGAKPGKPIPAGKLAAAAKKPGKLGQRARLAQTLKKMRKK